MRILVVKFQVKPEFRDAFIEVGKMDARGSTETEPGCARFDFLQEDKDPNTFYFYEVYDNDDAFQAHTKTDHFSKYRELNKPEWQAAPTTVSRCTNLYPADKNWKRQS
jgi:autoinducer 2-degrading protein